jgi:hypothetical protein
MKLLGITIGGSTASPPAETQAQRLARGDAECRENLITALVDDATGYQLSPGITGRNGILADVQRRRAARSR